MTTPITNEQIAQAHAIAVLCVSASNRETPMTMQAAEAMGLHIVCSHPAFASQPEAGAVPAESFWLIERGPNQRQTPHCWWNEDEPTIGMPGERGEWVFDATKATRYASKEDAERVAYAEHRAGSYAITSHALLAAAPQPVTAEREPSKTLTYYGECLRRIAAEVISENHLGWGNELNDLADRVSVFASSPAPQQASATGAEP